MTFGWWYNLAALSSEHLFCVAPSEYGGMAEWFKAAVLKTAVALVVTGGSNPSPSALVMYRGGAGVAERSRLLSGCRAKNSTQGSNPCLPA
jgi:hypothetical protein